MNTIRQWIRRVRRFVKPQQADRELNEELAFHLQERQRENLSAGISTAEARQAALRQFGGVEQIKEECRDVRGFLWLDHWIKDIRVACRALERNRGYASLAVFTLALGVGANSAMFSALNAVLFQPLPYADPDQLVQVVETNKWRGDYFAVAPGNYQDWKEQSTVFEHLAAYVSFDGTIMTDEDSYRVPAIRATASYFPTLGVEPELGRWFTGDEDYPTPQPVAVMSHRLWKTRFGGDTNIIGSVIQVNDEPHTVIGVMPVQFRHFSRYFGSSDAVLWFPDPFRNDPPGDRNIHRLGAVGRLKKDVSLSRAQGEMSMIALRLEATYPDSNKSVGIRLIPLHADLVEDSQGALLLLIGVTSFVLLIACVNVANLFLSRAVSREREMAIRVALGGGRSRLIRMLLMEGIVLGCLAVVVGIAFAALGAQIIRLLDPGNIPRIAEARLDWRVFLFMFAIAISGGVLAAIVPALQLSRPDLNRALKGGTQGFSRGAPQRRLRNALVVAEVALTVVLLCGAGLMVSTMLRLMKVNPGFATENLLVADLSLPRHRYLLEDGISGADSGNSKIWKLKPEAIQALQAIAERLSQSGGVVKAAVVDHLPMSGYGGWAMGFTIEGKPAPENSADVWWAYERPVTPGYFETLGMTLLKGRLIENSDTKGGVIPLVINEAGARKLWPSEDPIGQRISFSRGSVGSTNLAEVVGIVSNTRHAAGGDIGPEVYLHYSQIEKRYVDWQVGFRLGPKILLRSRSEPGGLVEPLRQIVREIDPAMTVSNIQPMTQRIAGTFKRQRRFMGFLVTFAGLALILAGVGIHAVIAYSVQQRMHELGIRMALGGSRHKVRNLVLRQGIMPVMVGLVAGIAGSIALTRLISSQLFGVKPVDPLTYLAVIAGLLMVCILACLIPANRVLSLNPWAILRDE